MKDINTAHPGQFNMLYFEKEGVKLLQRDCLDLIPKIKPESVITIFIDSPYNLSNGRYISL